jgi:outer membrane lipoprotein-sorting protein
MKEIPMTISVPARRAVALAALLSLAGAAWSAAPTSGVLQYDTELVMANQPPRKMAQKIWFKGQKFRIQNDTPMGNQLTVGGPGGVFVLMPGSKEAMKLPNRMPAKGGVPGLPFGDMARFQHQKKVGSEKVGAYTTSIYEQNIDIKMPGAAQKGSTRTWVSPTLPVPVKVVTKMPPNFQTTTVLKSVQLNVPVADSLFELPKGTKIRTQSSFPGAPPGGPPH